MALRRLVSTLLWRFASVGLFVLVAVTIPGYWTLRTFNRWVKKPPKPAQSDKCRATN